jgi:hypothetical protein
MTNLHLLAGRVPGSQPPGHHNALTRSLLLRLFVWAGGHHIQNVAFLQHLDDNDDRLAVAKPTIVRLLQDVCYSSGQLPSLYWLSNVVLDRIWGLDSLTYPL